MSRTTRTRIGSIEVTSLTDGAVEFGNEIFPNADDATISALLSQAGATAIETNFNAFLVKSGDATVLVDAGPRDLFGETCGFLGDALAEAGVTPGDVTHLMFTHLHPDHIAGSVTAAGEAVFPNARIFVSEAEHRFWNGETFTDETLSQWQQLATQVLAAYEDRTEKFAGNAEIVPGLSAMALPGHTPGHVGFRVDDDGQSLVHVGDIAHAQTLQFANPEISVVFDIDADTARATRKRTLDMLAGDGAIFSGGHMLRPTIGRLERAGDGYRFAEL